MSSDQSTPSQDSFKTQRIVDLFIRIALIALFFTWCFKIVAPFIPPLLWGVIIAVAVYPAYKGLAKRLGGNTKLAATIIVLVGLLVLIVPSYILGDSLYEGAQGLYDKLDADELKVPPPPENLETWPVIGPSLDKKWQAASANLDAFLEDYRPQIKQFAESLLAMAAKTGLAILVFVFSIIIAGIMLVNSESEIRAAHKFTTRIAGERGPELVQVTEATIRSVTKGILGVAVIQAVLAGIGLVVAGVPGAGLWAFLALILAVVQLGTALVLLPAAIWVFTTHSTPFAIGFLIFAIVVGLLDNVLKPIFLGRSAPVPMLVIFIGAIGGFLLSGIIGLFLGAVVFSLGYRLYLRWVEEGDVVEEAKTSES
jgi:predicted PurR-regulated permease PerM